MGFFVRGKIATNNVLKLDMYGHINEKQKKSYLDMYNLDTYIDLQIHQMYYMV